MGRILVSELLRLVCRLPGPGVIAARRPAFVQQNHDGI